MSSLTTEKSLECKLTFLMKRVDHLHLAQTFALYRAYFCSKRRLLLQSSKLAKAVFHTSIKPAKQPSSHR